MSAQKYQFQILPQDGGYVGYAMLNGEVVFTTPVCRDSIAASCSLSSFVSQKTNNNAIPVRQANSNFAPVPAMRAGGTANASPANNNPAPRSCCGRG